MDTWPLHWELFHRCGPQELYLGISQRRVSYRLPALELADIASYSFVLQLISLAGLHSNATITGTR